MAQDYSDTGELTKLRIAHEEHEAWLNLVAALREAGAVTPEDCQKSVAAPATTPGDRIFKAARCWGNRYARLCGGTPVAQEWP